MSLKKIVLWTWIYIVILVTVTVHGSNENTLPKFLVQHYDRLRNPEGPNGSPLNVTHNIQLKRVIALENQVLSLDAYVSMEWQDEQLQWDPKNFGGRLFVRLPSSLIWKPDIMLENNADRFSGVPSNDINVVVTYDGMVFYIPPVKLQSYCKMNPVRVKPHGQVTCSLKFLSWTYDGLSINLQNGPQEAILGTFENDFNKEWKLEDISVSRNVQKYECCPEPYIDLAYKLVLTKL